MCMLLQCQICFLIVHFSRSENRDHSQGNYVVQDNKKVEKILLNVFGQIFTGLEPNILPFFKLQSILNFRGFDFRNFRFNAVYASILFSSPLVLHTKLPQFTRFLLSAIFLCVPALIA